MMMSSEYKTIKKVESMVEKNEYINGMNNTFYIYQNNNTNGYFYDTERYSNDDTQFSLVETLIINQ